MGISMQQMARIAEGNLGMIMHTIADMTDGELFTRPVPGSNHPMWQLGHLFVSEANMVEAAGGRVAHVLPEGFKERFSKETASSDDVASFPSREELVKVMQSVRAAVCEWMLGLSDADLAQPSPESIRAFCPTIADLTSLITQHAMMHVGQIQVARRKLGKPYTM